jgi:tetratricopeptide (TPR) repeat protein
MNKGEELYKLGLSDRALRYFDEALALDPGLTFEIATYKHRIAVDLLTMADQMKELNSLKFVVYALEETKRLTGGLSKTNMRILDELKQKLAAKDNYEMRQKIDQILNEKKKQKESEKFIEVGMTLSEVEEIMGKPSEIISEGKDLQNQLWIYRYVDGNKVYLTFTKFKLFRIEEE